jgi:hypothetical protein
LFAPATTAGEKQQMPHGLKAARDDNSEVAERAITIQHSITTLVIMTSLGREPEGPYYLNAAFPAAAYTGH